MSGSHKFALQKPKSLELILKTQPTIAVLFLSHLATFDTAMAVTTESCRPNPAGHHMPRVLSISSDETLLSTRTMMLNSRGIEVEPVLGFSAAIHACLTEDFDLAVICHSIPDDEKEYFIKQVRAMGSMLILALRLSYERPLQTADYEVDSGDPQAFLDCVNRILEGNGQPG